MPEVRYEFVETPTFRRSAEGLLSDEELRTLQNALVSDLERGPIIPGTGGLRKIRVALPGGGKSGGARVVYYPMRRRDRVYLVLVYPKNVQATLSGEQKRRLRHLARQLEGEE